MRLARSKPRSDPATAVVGIVVPDPLSAAPGLEQLFRSFYERMLGRARAFAEHFAGRMDAEDAVHDAMADVWYGWITRGHEPVPDFLFLAMVRNKVVSLRRAGGDAVSLDAAAEELDDLAFRSHRAPERGDTPGDVLDLAIAALPPKRRAALLLSHLYDFTYAEVGTVMRVAEPTVKTHIKLALADVRQTFADAAFQYAAMQPAQPARLPAPAVSEEPSND